MKNILNFKYILVLVIFIAAFLRFYHLDVNPPSLTWDEVAWGYNAYSLGVDGKDEFGNFLPYAYLESFGDFKPPMYAYLAAIPVKLFGLNEFATRFPSALFGVFTVILTYFLVRKIFYSSKNAEIYALIATFMLAISPWHILLSRAAFEANVATFFLSGGLYAFLLGVRNNPKFLILSAVSFALSFYTFNTSRVFAPLIVFVLLIIFRKTLWKYRAQSVSAGIVGFLLILPIIPFLLSPEASLRFREVNIFSNPEIIELSNQKIENDDNSWWSNIINNRRLYFGLSFTQHYFDNLDPLFLFIKGDGNPKFSTQMVGQMYIWEIPFFIGGALLLFRKREGYWWIVPLWIALGIIPAASARETPHALRIATTLPMFQIITAYGLFWLGKYILELRHKFLIFKIKYGIVAIFSFVVLFNFMYFAHDYFNNYPKIFSGEWQYGYRESIAFAHENESEYDEIVVTQSLGRPYIYYLYYLGVDPEDFRANSVITRDAFGFVEVERYDKYVFKQEEGDSKVPDKRVLYIMGEPDMPENANILKTFYLLNGKPILFAYTL